MSQVRKQSRPHLHRMSHQTYKKVKDETNYDAKAEKRTANYLAGRCNDQKSFTGRLMRHYHRRPDEDGESEVAGVHVQILEIWAPYPVYFERLIDGESVRENFAAYRGTDRQFRVLKEMYPATDDRPAFFLLAEVGLRRAGTIRNTQRTGTEEIRPAKAKTNRRAHAYVHGEFVPARVTRFLTGRVEVQTVYGDVGRVADDDLVPEKKPSDVVAEGDILPLVVRQLQPLGLKLVEERSEEGQKAKDDGWRSNTDGCLVVPPDDVVKQFQDQHD